MSLRCLLVPLLLLFVTVSQTEATVENNAVSSAETRFLNGSTKEDGKCAALLNQVFSSASPISHIAHAIHSLTVRDLRRFFDPNATAINFVPTVNFNLTDDYALLDHATDTRGPSDAMFITDSMKSIDLILSHMSDENWDIKHFTALEKLVHIFHMQEMWALASEQMQIIKQTAPPTAAQCGV